jgi:hypothetical protein
MIGTQIEARRWKLLLAMLVMEAAFGIAGLIAGADLLRLLKDELSATALDLGAPIAARLPQSSEPALAVCTDCADPTWPAPPAAQGRVPCAASHRRWVSCLNQK